MRALTSSVVQTVPLGTSPDISMRPAPDIPVTSAQASQSRFVSSAKRTAGSETTKDSKPTFAGHAQGLGPSKGFMALLLALPPQTVRRYRDPEHAPTPAYLLTPTRQSKSSCHPARYTVENASRPSPGSQLAWAQGPLY